MLATSLDEMRDNHVYGGLAIVALVIILVYTFNSTTTRFPQVLSLIGEKPTSKSFSIKTRLRFYLNCSSMYKDIWDGFSRKGLPVLAPTLGVRKDIFLPHSSIKWMLSQPPNILGMWEAFNEMFQLSHSLGSDKYMLDTWVVDLTRRALTHDLEGFIEPMREELELSVDQLLGLDTDDWKTLDLMETIRMVVSRVGSRFTVGLPLCRNQEYLKDSLTCIEKIVSSAGAVGLVPPILRPIFGRLASWNTQRVLQDLETRCGGELQNRFSLVKASPDDRSEDPIDLLQQIIRHAPEHRPEEMNVEAMTRRLIMTNLGFLYQAGFAATNILRNILESDEKHDTINILRNEAEGFAAASAGDPSRLWTRSQISRMVFADSVARETLRLHTVPTRAIIRQVMVDGLCSDTGLPLPRGSLVSVVSQPMHTDPDLFRHPGTFDPFRFVQLRDADAARKKDQQQHGPESLGLSNDNAAVDDAGGNWSPHAFISTAKLLIFGRGRNSCPGRFFVDFQIKMLLHHLLINYDVKLADVAAGRPNNAWCLEFIFPPKGVKMLVKRRRAARNIK